MRRPGGYAVTSTPGERDVEEDSFTCCHCNAVVFVRPRMEPAELGGFCLRCSALHCPRQECSTCVPFEKKLEAYERRGAFLRAAGVG